MSLIVDRLRECRSIDRLVPKAGVYRASPKPSQSTQSGPQGEGASESDDPPSRGVRSQPRWPSEPAYLKSNQGCIFALDVNQIRVTGFTLARKEEMAHKHREECQ
jgi:hypothetical protein